MSGKPIGVAAHRRLLARSDRENLDQLARHYGLANLPSGAKWQALCIRLAQELRIPAFCQQAGKAGRKTRWTAKRQREIYAAVEGLRAYGLTLERACEHVSNGWFFPGNDAASIERRYKDARKSLRRQAGWPTISAVVSDVAREAETRRARSRAGRAAQRAGGHGASTGRRTV